LAQIDAYMILEAKGLANLSDGPIPGETSDKEMAEKKAIEISTFSISGQLADGRLEKKPDKDKKSSKKPPPRLNDKLVLSVSKNLDSSSPALMIAYCSHLSTDMREAKPFPSLKIFVRKTGDIVGGRAQAQYLRLSFEQVYLMSYTCGGSHESNKDRPTEKLEFLFKAVGMDYWPQDTQGRLSSGIAPRNTMRWNFY
jgi:type VI protein secretion system component Hcp